MSANEKADSVRMLSKKRSREIILSLLTHFGPMTTDEIYMAGLYMGNDGHRRKTLSIAPIPKRWPALYSLWDFFGHGVMLLLELQKEGSIRLCDGVDRWEVIHHHQIDADDLLRLAETDQCNWKMKRQC